MTGAALEKNLGSHPYWLSYVGTALWSINERLGGESGLSLAPFDAGFAEDAICALYVTAEALREDQEEAEGVMRDMRERY